MTPKTVTPLCVMLASMKVGPLIHGKFCPADIPRLKVRLAALWLARPPIIVPWYSSFRRKLLLAATPNQAQG